MTKKHTNAVTMLALGFITEYACLKALLGKMCQRNITHRMFLKSSALLKIYIYMCVVFFVHTVSGVL